MTSASALASSRGRRSARGPESHSAELIWSSASFSDGSAASNEASGSTCQGRGRGLVRETWKRDAWLVHV
ncbi:MAG: hypothetical protein LBM75_05070 [Myxococcales bacterium]|jgi:hypothetical protein|nr:hypothetical protein [Myxococcales bacterium]